MNIRNLIGFSLGPIGTGLISLITVPVITWYFTPGDVGKIAMLQVAISLCLLVFSLGLDQAYVREYHDSDQRSSLFKYCIKSGLILLIISCGVALLFPGLISSWLFDQPDSLLDQLTLVCIIASFLGRFFSLVLRMQEKGLAFSLSQLLPKILFLMIIGILVKFTTTRSLYGLLIANCAAFTFVAVMYAYNTRKEWLISSEKLNPKLQKQLMRFGLPLVLSGIAFWAMTSFDRLFLKKYAGYEQLGIYSVANSFAGAAILLQSVFSTVWAPIAYRWHSQGIDPKAIQDISNKILAVVVLIFSLGGLFSWIIALILPTSYSKAEFILPACLAYPLLYTLGETTGIGIGIKRKSHYILYASLASLAVNVAINYALVPKYGAAGAASATAISFLVLFISRTEISNRIWFTTPRIRTYLMIISCITLAVAYALYGHKHFALFTTLWLILATLNFIIFHKEFKTFIDWILKFIRSILPILSSQQN